MKKQTRQWIELLLAYGIIVVITMFSKSIVAIGSTVPARMILTVLIYVAIGAVVFLFVKRDRLSLSNLKISRVYLGRQILIGLCIFAFTFAMTVLIPLMAGMEKSDVLSFKSPTIPILIFYLIYDFLCVGLVEEFAFRGYFYAKFEKLLSVSWIPMLLSSILFGFFHFPNTLNLLNVLVTTAIGIVYGICRWKIKNCTLLSLTIAHGLQDAAILSVSFFLL